MQTWDESDLQPIEASSGCRYTGMARMGCGLNPRPENRQALGQVSHPKGIVDDKECQA
jgi:hypothetical protein